MPQILQLENVDGTRTLVALSSAGEDVQAISKLSEKALGSVTDAAARLDELLKPIVGLGTSIHAAIAGTPISSATVEVGIQFTASGTLYVVEAQAQAALNVTLSLTSDG